MPERSRLSFRYEYDASFFAEGLEAHERDDFGWLAIDVTTDRFCGRGGMWVQHQDVRKFGAALSVFPIAEAAPVVGRWGYNQGQGDDLILGLEVAPADKRGNLIVRFEIADSWTPAERVRASFLTNYPDIATFCGEIELLMDGKLQEAVLLGQ